MGMGDEVYERGFLVDICIECKHCRVTDYAWIYKHYCTKSLISIDPVTGYRDYKTCEEVRDPARVPKCDMFEKKVSWISSLLTR